MTKSKKLIVANWKMNPGTHTDASILFKGITKVASRLRNVQTVICPPFVFLDKLSQEYSGHRVLLGGQNLYIEESGAHTGEVSGSQLYSVGADYCIIGHSERRANGESDKEVQLKIIKALEHKLTPILCVGESERDVQGKYLHFLRRQIVTDLKKIKTKEINEIVIAYEPIWAIGKTGKDAITSKKLHETVLYIKRVLRETYNSKVAESAIILYGGSVKPQNAEELINEGQVDGFLVGGASLNAESFGEILHISNS
jgi:triosephosphate isomerase